jgi:hypothetical protein
MATTITFMEVESKFRSIAAEDRAFERLSLSLPLTRRLTLIIERPT